MNRTLLASKYLLMIASIAVVALVAAACSSAEPEVPPTPSWGRDLFGAARQYAELAPWMAIAPGVALSLAVYGFNLLGDAVRDVLDPRLRGT